MTRSGLAAAATVLVAAGAAMAAIPDGTPRARLALDTSAPLFTAANLRPGEARTACADLRNDGDAAGRAALYATGTSGSLAPFLQVFVTRGGEPIYRGRLDEFPRRMANAILEPAAAAPGTRRPYCFTLRLVDEPAAAGRAAAWDWHLAVDSVATPASSARSTGGCTSVQLAGTGVGRDRVLTSTVRVSARVRAVLRLRVSGSAAAPRVAVTTGLRVRSGKTLVIPGWARVRYRLNGGGTIAVGRRPFRARLGAAAFRPGRNRVSVAVQKRRGAAKALAAFTLNVSPARIAGRDVCVMSA